jgi:hypothetical protein
VTVYLTPKLDLDLGAMGRCSLLPAPLAGEGDSPKASGERG